MASIEQMVSVRPGLIPQVTGALTHARFWAATVLVDHYYEYCYAHLMRVTSSEETLWEKEAYDRLADTHGSRVCAYRVDNGRFVNPLFKEVVKT